jgi:matrixin
MPSQRLCLTLVLGVLICAGCGSSSPSSPSTAATGSALRGSTVSAVDGQPLGGVTVQIGSQSAVSDAGGAFRVDSLPPGIQSAILSASSVVERRTTLVTPTDDLVKEDLIPDSFDLQSFDEMFRGNGRLERWTSAPSLVVLTTVMTYASSFGDGHQYHATSDQLTEAETDLLVAQLTDALALLTGNTFTAFAGVTREPALPGALVETLRPGQIVVGRYKGIQGLLNTIGFGRWATDERGQVTAGAVYLDNDFDRTNAQRRLLRMHELGHALGYNHVTARTSIMNPAIGPEPTTFDRQGAAIAFQRLPGNQSPDSDPATPSSRSATGLFTVSPITR